MPRGVYARKPRASSTAPPSSAVKMTLGVDAAPYELTISNGRVIGRLLISSGGVKFLTANAKKKPERPISWATLARLQELGF